MKLYENIKKVAKSKGRTIAEIEKDLNLGKSTISKYDAHTPSIEKISKIADYLGVSIDQLIGSTDGYYLDPEAAEMAQELFDNPGQRVLFNACRGLSSDDLMKVVEFIQEQNKKEGRD